MVFQSKRVLLLFIAILIASTTLASAQGRPGEGTDLQRLEVMREKLDRIRRSLNSVIAVLKEENKEDKRRKDDEKKLDTPLGRLVALEKDASRLNSDVNSLRGKADRGEKYERSMSFKLGPIRPRWKLLPDDRRRSRISASRVKRKRRRNFLAYSAAAVQMNMKNYSAAFRLAAIASCS
jgi:hypothetical protein